MKHKFFSLLTSFALVLGFLCTTYPSEARGGRAGCGRAAGNFGGCIRSPGTYGRGPVCGPFRGSRPRYGFGGGFGGGFGFGYGNGLWDWGLPCYDGGSPYMCDIKAPPPPPPPVYIYPGGTVVREYGKPEFPGGAPRVVNVITASPGGKPTVIGK